MSETPWKYRPEHPYVQKCVRVGIYMDNCATWPCEIYVPAQECERWTNSHYPRDAMRVFAYRSLVCGGQSVFGVALWLDRYNVSDSWVDRPETAWGLGDQEEARFWAWHYGTWTSGVSPADEPCVDRHGPVEPVRKSDAVLRMCRLGPWRGRVRSAMSERRTA